MTRIRNSIHIACRLAPWVALVSAAGFAKKTYACDQTQQLCVAYQVDLDDDDPETGWGGSISLGPKAPARGVRITIIRPPPEPPLGLYLDDEGCVDFPTQFAAGHKVLVHPSAILGPSHNIRISMFDWTMVPGVDGGDLYLPIDDASLEPTASDVCIVGPVADNADILCDVPASDVANLMAVATHVVHRLTSLPGNVLTVPDELRVVRIPSLANYGHYDAINRWLVAGGGLDRRKFIFAHEIGHWLQSRTQVAEESGGSTWTVNYGYPISNENVAAAEPSCQFAVDYEAPLLEQAVETAAQARLELHGIRSAEYGNAAMTEGFAHFVAATAFNSITSETGEFVYYKDIDIAAVPAYVDLDEGDGLVALPGTSSAQTPGGWNGWVRNSCADDWNVLHLDVAEQNRVEIGTEIDWLRYFWEFVTSQDVALAPQPDFWDVAKLLAHTREHNTWGSVVDPNGPDGRVWENLVQTLGEDPEGAGLDDYLERFEALNDTHWVWHDPSL